MKKLRIGIIDDDPSKITQIMAKLMQGIEDATPEKINRYSEYELEPIEVELEAEPNDMIQKIKKYNLDCILLDYKLASRELIDYTGIELAKYFQEAIYDFPLFILTSYEDDLFNNEIFNAYQVFDFARYLNEPLERIELNFKIIEQVLKTKKQQQQWEDELKRLLPLAGKSAEIDARLLELDTMIEKSIDGIHIIPEKIKTDLKENPLNELLSKIDEILRED